MISKKIQYRSQAKNYNDIAFNGKAIDSVLADIFLSRGSEYKGSDFYTLAKLIRPDTLKGLDKALERLRCALEQQERILVVGDFDADGATSTALALRCLQAFGAKFVDFLVPNRFVYGYGLTPEIVVEAASRSPDLIITVDNGISSVQGVDKARQLGIDVIVTDHHLPGRETPNAQAIVNPNQHGCEFPSKHLAGVGVIFYTMLALRSRLREGNWFKTRGISEPNMGQFLDLVALGTVADVVPLDDNNRVLVDAGLKRMRAGQAVAGIRALLRVAGKDTVRLSSQDLGFILGPRLNAAGRLDDMAIGIRCLLTDNDAEALELANALDDFNRDRKNIEAGMQAEALKLLDDVLDTEMLQDVNGVCLYKDDWHQGVIGILASRIKDRLHRPTIAFAKNDESELKGSGRSIPGVHMRDVLDEIASANPGLIEKFGGHAMAAGLSLPSDQLDAFRFAFDEVVGRHLTEENKHAVILSDGELPESLLNFDLAFALRNAGPWGQGFPEPIFHGVFRIVNQRIVGHKHLKLVLARDAHSPEVFDAIAFNVDLERWPAPQCQFVKMAYQLDINEFRGEERLQLLVTFLEPVD